MHKCNMFYWRIRFKHQSTPPFNNVFHTNSKIGLFNHGFEVKPESGLFNHGSAV